MRTSTYGTKANNVWFEIGERGIRMTIFTGCNCVGWTPWTPYNKVRIDRDPRHKNQLQIHVGGMVYWVKAKRLR